MQAALTGRDGNAQDGAGFDDPDGGPWSSIKAHSANLYEWEDEAPVPEVRCARRGYSTLHGGRCVTRLQSLQYACSYTRCSVLRCTDCARQGRNWILSPRSDPSVWHLQNHLYGVTPSLAYWMLCGLSGHEFCLLGRIGVCRRLVAKCHGLRRCRHTYHLARNVMLVKQKIVYVVNQDDPHEVRRNQGLS